jgi:hypothetical protein
MILFAIFGGLPRPRLGASFLATPALRGRPRGRVFCGSFTIFGA